MKVEAADEQVVLVREEFRNMGGRVAGMSGVHMPNEQGLDGEKGLHSGVFNCGC